jgi:signal transduction histidine kinase
MGLFYAWVSERVNLTGAKKFKEMPLRVEDQCNKQPPEGHVQTAQSNPISAFRLPWRRTETFNLSVVGLLFAHGLISALIAGSLLYEKTSPGPYLVAMLLGLGLWLAFWAVRSRIDVVGSQSIFFFTLATTATVVALTTLSIGDSAPAVLFLPVAAVIAGSTMPRRSATLAVLGCSTIAVLGILVAGGEGIFSGNLTNSEARIFESFWVQGFGIVGLTAVGGLVAARIGDPREWDENDRNLEVTVSPDTSDGIGLTEALAQDLRTGVARFDVDGRLVFSNAAFNRIANQVLAHGKKDYDLWTLVRAIPHLGTALTQSIDGFIEGELSLGRRKHLLAIRVMAMKNPGGKGPDLMVLIDDHTSQRAMERLAMRGEHAERVSLLASGISHDLANTMTVAQGLSTVVQRQLPEDSPLRNDLHLVISACQRTAQLGREVISLKPQPNGSMPRFSSVLNVVRTQRNLLNRLAPSGSDVRFEMEDQLPMVALSEQELGRVVMNLATYCIGSTGQTGRVQFDFMDGENELDEPGVRIVVRDNGPPMTVEDLEEVLEGRTTGTWTEPSLALAVVRNIVEEAGGKIWAINSTEAFPGTNLEVFLPASKEGQEVTRRPLRSAPSRSLLSRPLVWVIEDSHVQSGKVVAALARRGFVSRISRHTQGVKRDLRSLVRLDLLAFNPNILGSESVSFIRRLRNRFPGVPILIMEYLERNPEFQSFDEEDAGLNYLATPFDDRGLNSCLDRLRITNGFIGDEV